MNFTSKQTSGTIYGDESFFLITDYIALFLVGAFYQNEPDYYSSKFFFFFFRQTTECMRGGHFFYRTTKPLDRQAESI